MAKSEESSVVVPLVKNSEEAVGSSPEDTSKEKSSFPDWFWIVGSIVSTVSIVQVNKAIMVQWPYSATLSMYHFVLQAIGFELAGRCGLYEIKKLPPLVSFQIAGWMSGSIAFNNGSLYLNSVGFFQGAKLLTIPCIMLMERYMDPSKTYSTKCKFAIAVLITGMGLATVSDPQTNTLGLVLALLALICTGAAQIMNGTRQAEYGVNAAQISNSIMLPMAVIVVVPTVVIDGTDTLTSCPVGLVLLSGFLAGCVNLFAYGIIGKMSPVTYQIVGTAKTMLVIFFGTILFYKPGTTSLEMGLNLGSLGIALCGMVLYSHIKQQEKTGEPDVLDSLGCCKDDASIVEV